MERDPLGYNLPHCGLKSKQCEMAEVHAHAGLPLSGAGVDEHVAEGVLEGQEAPIAS
jgi:hypothetical protein